MRPWLAAAALAAVALGGCGGDDAERVAPRVLAEAARVSAASGGYAIELRTTLTAEGRETVSEGRGSVGAGNRRLQMLAETPDAPGAEIDSRADGKVFYQRATDATPRIPPGKEWIRIDYAAQARRGDLAIDMTALPLVMTAFDPREAIAQLAAVRGVEKAGRETVGGEPTTRYRATVDLRLAAERAPAAKRAEARRIVETALPSLGLPETWPVEAWVSDGGRVRRVRMGYEYEPPGASAPVEFELTADFDLYGSRPQIALPDPRKVIDAHEVEFKAGPGP